MNTINSIKKGVFKLVLVTIVVLFSNVSFAQTDVNVTAAEQFTLKSKVLNEDRVLSVYLPDDYATTSNKYPVLYLLDGRTHFQHAISAVNYLATRNLIPNVIVVSIHNIDRRRDFSPIHHETMPTSGGADKFLEFLSAELTSYMKKNYRTSDFSLILGHSFGGTFIAYSLIEKPELFDGYIAVSPYLQYAGNYMVNETKGKLKLSNSDKKYFYMTVGDEPRYFEPLKKFSEIMKQQPTDALQFKYVKMEGENHGTTPYLTLFNGLRFIFSDWNVPQELMTNELSDIDKHFTVLSKKYGIDVKTPENLINNLGYRKLLGGDLDAAIILFQENVKRYPKSSNVYDSLGEAFEKNKQIDLAKKNYKKACQLAVAEANPNFMIFLRNLERVGGKFKI